ncbi:MAG: TrkA family potassium uptake protein [Planctomycetes bacterium]|nr:TrkA family potassium uptake protein [Planctomycetota bacterium]
MAGEFVVIGLGIFGQNVALRLTRAGHSVLALDRDPAEVQAVADEIDAALCLDTTDEEALRGLGLERMTCAVVAIGTESIEASILTTALLRQIGVPRIVARAVSDLHGRVLLAVGAHQVVSPEAEMGERLARQLGQPNVLERLELGEGVEAVELEAPQAFVGKTLVELDLRRRYGITVAAVRRGGRISATISGEDRVENGDVLLVIGSTAAIQRIAALA